VRDTFRDAMTRHGAPASTLTDNAMVFTTRLAGGKDGRNRLETELRRLGIVQKNSRPNHPTTCGKVERFQQTMKAWLRHQPDQPSTIAELQQLCDRFADIYNHHRPHRSLPHQATPVVSYTTRPKASPGDRSDDTHFRVRHDRVADGGSVTLRVNGQLHHIGVGRHHTGTRIVMLIADLDIRIIHATTGEVLRHLTLDPDRRYHGTGTPQAPQPRQQQPPEP
jgi:hypothetical protein